MGDKNHRKEVSIVLRILMPHNWSAFLVAIVKIKASSVMFSL